MTVVLSVIRTGRQLNSIKGAHALQLCCEHLELIGLLAFVLLFKWSSGEVICQVHQAAFLVDDITIIAQQT